MRQSRVPWTYAGLVALLIGSLTVVAIEARRIGGLVPELLSARSTARTVEKKKSERGEEARELGARISSYEKSRQEAEAKIASLEATDHGRYLSAIDLRSQKLYGTSTKVLEDLVQKNPTSELVEQARALIVENRALAQEWEQEMRGRRKARLRRDDEARTAGSPKPTSFSGVVDRAVIQAERSARGEVRLWIGIALPDGARVWAVLSDEKTGRVLGESWAVLRDGVGQAEGIGASGPPIVAGRYAVRIESSLSSPGSLAPEAMEKVERHAEKLSGRLVTEILTARGRQKIVRYETEVTVPETVPRVEMAAKRGGGQAAGVWISGSAGLPDHAALRLRCFDAGGERISGEIEPTAEVQGGAFLGEVGLLRQPAEGDFCEAAFFPGASEQPKAIRRAFGRKGEKLAGPQVETDPLTGASGFIASARIQ